MKTIIVCLLMCIVAVGIACSTAPRNTNANVNASPSPTPDKAAIEAYRTAMVDGAMVAAIVTGRSACTKSNIPETSQPCEELQRSLALETVVTIKTLPDESIVKLMTNDSHKPPIDNNSPQISL